MTNFQFFSTLQILKKKKKKLVNEERLKFSRFFEAREKWPLASVGCNLVSWEGKRHDRTKIQWSRSFSRGTRSRPTEEIHFSSRDRKPAAAALGNSFFLDFCAAFVGQRSRQRLTVSRFHDESGPLSLLSSPGEFIVAAR